MSEIIYKCDECNRTFYSIYTHKRHCEKEYTCKKITRNELTDLIKCRQELQIKNQMIVEMQNLNLKLNKEMQDKFLELHNENEALKLENRDLKTKFELINEIKDALINKPNTNNNNNNNKTINNNIIVVKNPKPFGKECFDIKKFEIERHLLKGQQGLATFVYESILIDKHKNITNYICADPARRICKMLCDDFNWKKDINSHYLSIILSEIFRNENCDVWNRYMQYMDEHQGDMDAITRMEWNNKISQELVDIKSRDPKFLKKLMEELMAKIYKEKYELNNIKFEKEYGYKIGTSAEYSEEEYSEEEYNEEDKLDKLVNDQIDEYFNDQIKEFINIQENNEQIKELINIQETEVIEFQDEIILKN